MIIWPTLAQVCLALALVPQYRINGSSIIQAPLSLHIIATRLGRMGVSTPDSSP
jgi:hypothetical protein